MIRGTAITLRQLRAFVAVAEEGSIVRAALRLHLTASALSMLLSALEGELGSRLFERTTRRMVLTDAGQALLPSVRLMFDQFADGLDRVRAQSAERSARLRIAASPLLSAMLLPPVLALFQARHPQVRLSLHDVAVNAVAQLVRSSEADLGICTADVDALDLQALPLMQDRLVAVCGDTHPLAGRATLRWCDLATQPLVLMRRGSGLRTLTERGLSASGEPVVPAYEVAHVATAVGLVEAGMGVAVLPAFALRRSRAVGVCAIALVEPVIERAIVALHAPQHPLTAEAQAFLALLAVDVQADAAAPAAGQA